MNKYGYDNPAKHPDIKEKMYQTWKNKKYKKWNNKNNYYISEKYKRSIYWQSSNELEFIKWCEQISCIKNVKRGPMIRIKGASKGICVVVDFLITYTNKKSRLVEVKGNHNGWRRDKETGRWHVERYFILKYTKEHNYLYPYLLLNNNSKVYERIANYEN